MKTGWWWWRFQAGVELCALLLLLLLRPPPRLGDGGVGVGGAVLRRRRRERRSVHRLAKVGDLRLPPLIEISGGDSCCMLLSNVNQVHTLVYYPLSFFSCVVKLFALMMWRDGGLCSLVHGS